MRRLIIAGLLGSLCVASTHAEDLTAASYWQLTRERLELASLEWQDRIASAQQAGGDRQLLIEGSQAVALPYGARHEELLSRHSTTEDAYRKFATDHSREIESYLLENAEVKKAIADLQQKNAALIDRLESITRPIMSGKP